MLSCRGQARAILGGHPCPYEATGDIFLDVSGPRPTGSGGAVRGERWRVWRSYTKTASSRGISLVSDLTPTQIYTDRLACASLPGSPCDSDSAPSLAAPARFVSAALDI